MLRVYDKKKMIKRHTVKNLNIIILYGSSLILLILYQIEIHVKFVFSVFQI